ncbi:acyl carrier protein [Microcoleus sp. K4-B3]
METVGTDIKTKIRQFILSEMLVDESEENLKDDTPLRKGILDSLGTVQMVNFIESEWDIEVGAMEADDSNFGTLNGLVAFIERKLQKQQKQ